MLFLLRISIDYVRSARYITLHYTLMVLYALQPTQPDRPGITNVQHIKLRQQQLPMSVHPSDKH